MNAKSQRYWDDFWRGKNAPTSVMAEQFGYGGLVDELAQLIIEGKKTATCSAAALYEPEDELPAVGNYTIILNSNEEPGAIIKTTEVLSIKMNEVTPQLAAEEGEGDLSYDYWYNSHKEVFITELARNGMKFSDDMLLLFERFQLVNVKETL